jgi:hypothetical protein
LTNARLLRLRSCFCVAENLTTDVLCKARVNRINFSACLVLPISEVCCANLLLKARRIFR